MQKRLETTSDHIQETYLKIKDWDALPLRVISWQQALAMISEGNAEVVKSKQSVATAEREVRSVYTDMIPKVSYYGIFDSTIEELTTGTADVSTMSSNVNVSFSIPTMTQVPYRVYAAQASLYAAEKALEGKNRELAVKLYQLLRQNELDERLQKLKDDTSLEARLTSVEKEKQRSRGETYWRAIASLLGNYEARWSILPESVPRVQWKDYQQKITTLDPLIVCNMAMRIERARLMQYNIALDYLPTINTNLSSPSLFSSSGGTYSGTFLSSSDTTLNLSLSYSLDTDLSSWNSYQKNKENFEIICREVYESMMDRRVQLKALAQSVREYERWRGYMRKRIAFEKQSPILSPEQYLDRQKALYEMERELLTQEKSAIDSEVALATEYGLPGS